MGRLKIFIYLLIYLFISSRMWSPDKPADIYFLLLFFNCILFTYFLNMFI